MKFLSVATLALIQASTFAGVVDLTTFSPGTNFAGTGGISNNGVTVGWFQDPSTFDVTGYERLADGTIVPVNFPVTLPPNDLMETVPGDVNDSGTIVGTYFNVGRQAFILASGVFSTVAIDVDGTIESEGFRVSGINDSGEIVGDQVGPEFFILQSGITTLLSVTGVPTLNDTAADSINDLGQVSGSFFAALGHPQVFIRNTDGTFVTFDFPVAACESAMSDGGAGVFINDNGQLAGNCVDSQSNTYAFYGTPGNFTTFEIPGSAPLSTEISGINDSGEIIGTFSNGQSLEGFTAFIVPEPSTLLFALTGFAVAGVRVYFEIKKKNNRKS